MTDKEKPKKSNTKKIIIGIIFIGAIITIFLLQQNGYIDIDSFGEYIRGQGYLGWLIFIGVYIVGTVFAFPGALLTLTAGYIFNSGTGFFIVVIGATLGATLSFIFARYLFHDYFHDKFSHSKLLQWSKTEDQKKLTSAVFVMRLLPIFPFNAMNYGLGLTKIKTRNYFAATLIGIMPGTFIYVFLGSSLNDIFSAKFLIAIVLMIVFTIIASRIAKKTKLKKSGEVDIPLDGHEIQVTGTHVEMKDRHHGHTES